MSDQPPAKKFYLTTPIYYVNARPHIGHAYTTIVADVIARRSRALGVDTYFLTGTDEHGQKIERSAAAAGIPPQQFADQVSKSFENLWQRMGITHDQFIRTTSEKHKRGVQKLFTTLQSLDKIYLSSYTGQYSIGEEMFVDGPPGTIGPDGKPTETVTEENYFFRLSEYQLPLLNLIQSGQLAIQPEVRKNEVLSFLRGNVSASTHSPGNVRTATQSSGEAPPFSSPSPDSSGAPSVPGPYPGTDGNAGSSPATTVTATALSAVGIPYLPGALKDLSISRTSFKWGVPVPIHPETEGHAFRRAEEDPAEGGSALPKAVLADAATKPTQDHVIYVWLDALANYMTAVGYGSEAPEDIAQFEKYWPADLHLVGKEIIRFHCVYWPAFLLALNPAIKGMKPEDIPFEVHSEWAKKMLPKAITAHGWLLFEDSKMSKSRGNIVRTETILDAFGTLCPATLQPALLKGTASAVPQTPPSTNPALAAEVPSSREPTKEQKDLFAADILRYFLLREIPFGQDGGFSFDALVTRYNADLANGYGNLVSRTLSMIQKYFDGKIPFGKMDESIGLVIRLHASAVRNNYSELDFSSLLHNVSSIIRAADQHITSMAPWKVAADISRTDELRNILYTSVESIRIVTTLLQPILPYAAAQVFSQLGIPSTREPGTEPKWTANEIGSLSPIFPRAPKELIQLMTDMENPTLAPTPSKFVDETTTHTAPIAEDSTDPAAPPRTFSPEGSNPTVAGSHAITTERPGTPTHSEAHASGVFASTNNQQPTTNNLSPQIAIDDFVKIDLRVAKIIVAERIPKADKLLRLEVDLGYEKRQILSGIAEWYTPEELIGKRIVVIANLAPRKMRGLESHGMLLAASNDQPGPDGQPAKPILATFPDTEDLPLGSRLR